MYIIYGSVALIALAFVVLVAYVVRFIKTAELTLKETTETLTDVSTTLKLAQQQVEGVAIEAEQLLKKSNALVDDLQVTVKMVNDVSETVEEVGETVKETNSRVRHLTSEFLDQLETGAEQLYEVLKWTSIVTEFMTKFTKKERRDYEREKRDSYNRGVE